MSQTPRARVLKAFADTFGEPPSYLVRAPGRVNLIGEHTDYNDGFVLPMAIEHAVWIALRPLPRSAVVLHSLDFGDVLRFDLEALERGAAGWSEYVKGVAWALSMSGHRLAGWEGVVAGDVPLGAGLSSSAALELATARAFAMVSGLTWDATEMARQSQRAENEWVGMRCGIMDQMISAAGKRGHALLIDCRTLETRPARLPGHTDVVILDTATRRGLVDSAYNERRAQCEAAAQLCGVTALRDVDEPTLLAFQEQMDPVMYRRARHVVTENARTLKAVEAMDAVEAERLGHLMNESHWSLRDDFEVSREELDVMVRLAQEHRGCYGARMTGAGFGGCAVALVESEAVDDFTKAIEPAYRAATGLEAQIYRSQAAEGASVEPVAA